MGVSGWRYASWRGDFYPPGLVQRRELEYIARQLTSVELNGSFYSLQRPTTYQRLVDETPDDFVVAVKGSRYLTHMKRLADAEPGLARFFDSGVFLLGPKLGPILWQLPKNFAFDPERVGTFLDLLPRTHDGLRVRHALEPRHVSFGSAEALSLLREKDVALVASDSPRAWPCFEEVTSDHVYVRLHGHTELYASGYAAASLDRWADKCRGWVADGLDVLVYFDNDARGRAPHDAVALLQRLER